MAFDGESEGVVLDSNVLRLAYSPDGAFEIETVQQPHLDVLVDRQNLFKQCQEMIENFQH